MRKYAFLAYQQRSSNHQMIGALPILKYNNGASSILRLYILMLLLLSKHHECLERSHNMDLKNLMHHNQHQVQNATHANRQEQTSTYQKLGMQKLRNKESV